MAGGAAGGVEDVEQGGMMTVLGRRRFVTALGLVAGMLLAGCTTHGRVGVLPTLPQPEQAAEIVVIR